MKTLRKRLDDDCLLDGELHPSIAERLHRIRELPVTNVANFHGVEVDAEGVWLVWQYIDGVTLEDFFRQSPPTDEIARIKKELQLTLSSIHSHGIVHGAIHGRNVIIDPQGRLHVTHISALLFSDPAEDDKAVVKLFATDRASGRNTKAEVGRDRIVLYIGAAAALLSGVAIFAAILWYIHG